MNFCNDTCLLHVELDNSQISDIKKDKRAFPFHFSYKLLTFYHISCSRFKLGSV
ncbi:hypothetical protein GYO_2687 [Bacillus spizizenii TU-B-10]|uniref:Uncharacterized protein n=1 Tax=Bacillus spizizenii (strain DSM 15029 / JCM 12233 / NBRC 101239 / NRRL B-23049 / TU-B-10) TaxID=1052585 RepID=G4NQ50_BACS4|nr:hypothetical protein GYO_2687 [Bacillus spizizenii TU-B-10]SCV42373.1 hypothetical protein BQ1740_2979 [Bacillus subtilis]